MFTLVKEPAHWWPVTFDVAVDDGVVETMQVDLKFTRLGVQEYHELWSTQVATAIAVRDGLQAPLGREEIAVRDRTLFDRCVRDWRKIVDPDGRPVPFEDVWIARMLDVSNFLAGFGAAYSLFWHAIPGTIQGNSEPSPDGGQATADAVPPAVTKTTKPRSQRRSESGAPAKHT